MMQNCHMQKTKKIISLTLCFLFMLLMVLSADVVNDYQDHYAKESIKELFEKGVITGYEDGSFKPDREISRAEFMTIINRAFSFKEQAEISFSDVVKDQWHYEQIAVAVKAGYIKGFTDGTMRPTANITRQEAAVIIARILDIEKDGDIKKLTILKDGDKVPQWSAQGVAAIVERNYIELKENKLFQPTQNLTRADMAIAIVRSQEDAIAKLYDKSGTYTGGKIDGNVKIDNKGITLKDTEINGDLILGEGIKDGDVHLISVTVKGDTIVKGGGENTITLENCQFEKIIILKEDGKVRILAKGNTRINRTEIKSGATLESQDKSGESFGYITIAEDISEGSIVELIGDFKSIEIKGSGVDIQASGGTIANLIVAKGTKDIEIDLAKDAKVAALTVDSPAKITGTGKIDKATVNAQGVKIEATVTKIETAPGIEVDIPKKETTPTTGGGGGGSKGSGGTSTPAKTEVGTITVTGEGGATTITTDGGTLQMKAEVEPANASNKNVTWYVNDTNVATIDGNGKLTAKANGTVKVTAKAKDGSGKSGYVEITISNQTVTPPLSNAKAIISFKFESLSPIVTGVIDEIAKTINLTVPYATNVTALVPTIIHTGDNISPAKSAINFTNPVIYNITAEDGSTAKYTATVTIAPTGSHILTYIAEEGGTITGTSPQTVAHGEDGTSVTAVPDEGYVFAQWSDGVPTAERTDTNVITSGTYTAIFASDIKTVGFESLTANGTSGATTTTVLYVRFDQEIPRLSPENITLEGATLELLSMGSTSNECSITIEDIKVKNGENVKVTINKEGYLFTPTSKEVEVYVANIQAEINPASAVFDKKKPENVVTNIDFGTATKIEFIKKGDIALTEGNDYTVSGNTLTIKKEYLLAQPVGTTKLDIAFDQGYTREFSINISNEGTYSIVVEEITGGFGGETATASKNNTEIEEAKEGEHITITITDLTGTYDVWKVKSAKFKDDNGVLTNLNTSSKIIHSFTMPASNVTVIIELEPEEDSESPTISNSEITANRITDISLTLNWDKATDNLTPDSYLKYYVYQSELNNIGSVADAENNGKLLNPGGIYILKNLNVKDLAPDKTYYFNVVVDDHAGNKTAYTMKEVKTLKAITDLDLTSKVTKPVKYGKINFTFAAGEQYSSTNAIIWWKVEGDTKEQVYGNFDPDTVYQADVTLEANNDYSFNDLAVFTYTDATDVSFETKNIDPSIGYLTITFPATEAVTKYSFTLEGDNITSEPQESQIAENTKVTVTVNPNDGEQVVSFIVNGVEEKQSLENNKYTFTITQDTIIKVTYSDEYALISSGDPVVEFKVNGTFTNIAKKGDTVTMIVTPAQGKELIEAELEGIDKDSVTEDEIGKKYTFVMPNNAVDVDIKVGDPNKKLSINLFTTGDKITLTNGKLSGFEDLSWSYFTNTLTMDNFSGDYLSYTDGEPIKYDLELKNTNTIESSYYKGALNFYENVTINGDGTLKIKNSGNYNTEVLSGIGFRSYNHFEKFKDNATIEVTAENAGNGGVAITNTMPFIGNGKVASKATSTWGAGHGSSPENPIEINYYVAENIELKGENIIAWSVNYQVTDIKSGGFDGSLIAANGAISFTDGKATIYAKYLERYYKLTIEEIAAIPVTDVELDKCGVTLAAGGEITLVANISPENATNKDVIWSSSNKDVATVDENGKVTAVAAGAATITVKTVDGEKTAECIVSVVEDQSATVDDVIITGIFDEEIDAQEIKLTLAGTTFEAINKDESLNTWFTNRPSGLTAKAKVAVNKGDTSITIVMGGKPSSASDSTISIRIPASMLSSNKMLEATTNVNAKYDFPKYIIVGGVDGDKYKLGESTLPEGLTWDDSTDTLSMEDYDGASIKGNFTIIIEVKEDNKITVTTEALFFNTLTLKGNNKETDKLIINVTGSGTRAVHRYLTIENMTLEIEAELSNPYNSVFGVSDNTTIDGGYLKLKVNKSDTSNTNFVYGISTNLTLKKGATADFEITGAEGTTRMSTHNDAPWISKALKVVAGYKAGDGVDADHPFTMTVTVPSTVSKIKSQGGELDEGVSSILVGESGIVTLYKESDTTNYVDKIDLLTDSTFYAKTSKNVWFKITIEKD